LPAKLAHQNDIILIAGKGHETYQEIKGVRYDFDDMETVKEILEPTPKIERYAVLLI
jgi:UDP-N-acetylmuramoyl-L-alanyl-D-glutamate--2,6-diaminopimelate ligase